MKFVFDLDGTICFQNIPVSEKILTALEALEAHGHMLIFASARPVRDMLPVLHHRFHHHAMIGGNGAVIYNKGQLVHSVTFADELVEEMLQLLASHDAAFLMDGTWNYAYHGEAGHPFLQGVDPDRLAQQLPKEELRPVLKLLVLEAERMEDLAEKLASFGITINRHTNEQVLDLSPNNVHKWSALETIGLNSCGYIAFGNDANDMTMFEHALHSVMVGSHDGLAPFAKEAILHGEALEERIIAKIHQLAAEYESDES